MSNPKETPQADPATAAPQSPVYPSIDPRMMAAMYASAKEDELDLLALWGTLWSKKKLILWSSFGVAILTAVISFFLPNIYRAEVLLSPVSSDASKAGVSSTLGGLSGLASLAGVTLPGGGNVGENLAVLTSRDFLWTFINEEKLMPALFKDSWDSEANAWKESNPEEQPTSWDAYRLFTKGGLLSADVDKDTGLVTVAVEWRDADQAAAWANILVRRLNEHLRTQAINVSQRNLQYLQEELRRTQIEEMRRALLDLIVQEQKKAMLASTQLDFAFRTLDAAVAPDKKARPNRTLIVILATILAGMVSGLWVLVATGIAARTQNEAVAP